MTTRRVTVTATMALFDSSSSIPRGEDRRRSESCTAYSEFSIDSTSVMPGTVWSGCDTCARRRWLGLREAEGRSMAFARCGRGGVSDHLAGRRRVFLCGTVSNPAQVWPRYRHHGWPGAYWRPRGRARIRKQTLSVPFPFWVLCRLRSTAAATGNAGLGSSPR
jgi:hypothetical protein